MVSATMSSPSTPLISLGAARPGTCYCPNANFGRPYCGWNPRWYHTNGRGVMYKGDRHPEIGHEFEDECFEPEPRKCGNCGEVTRLLKKEFCKP